MGNTKYVFVRHDAEINSVIMSRDGGGGATATKTKDAIIIGIWMKDTPMQPKGVQNAGDCSI